MPRDRHDRKPSEIRDILIELNFQRNKLPPFQRKKFKISKFARSINEEPNNVRRWDRDGLEYYERKCQRMSLVELYFFFFYPCALNCFYAH